MRTQGLAAITSFIGAGPGGPGEPLTFYPVSKGRTAEEAVNRAIERYNRKHGIAYWLPGDSRQRVNVNVVCV